ncbi:hypothetical protein [Vreelandella maris]|uniref:Curlin associated repeat-containing protein n=1 Tax=Vreelandella maris TaxID=2729617 RepID=A0A7Y6RBG6_9GAMM|nr:hypothetical protein [Halomonas maris]NVF13851.1 hypothetical protein [Halomonas maris]|tara:strand:+ start:518 stop:1240 length:723 start_codon:yes stop_codon:yes gene_type:complete
MKLQLTTIAAAVAIALSSASFAQTTPSTTFNGSINTIDTMAGYTKGSGAGSDSYITQTAGSDDNVNNVTQWGTQYSRITQTGDRNRVTVVQDDEVGVAKVSPGFNESIVRQEGNDNKVKLNQLGEYNDSWIKQDGSDNDSLVEQDGNLNDSYISSVGNGNIDRVYQGGNELDSHILTDGNRNVTKITQTGEGHDSFVRTVGNDNRQIVSQSGVGGLSNGQHFSQILTTGSGNANTVYQGY